MRCLVAVVIAVVGTASVAHAGVEVGGVAGLHTFSEKSDLGVVRDGNGDPVPAATSLKNSALFGARLGVYFGKNLGVELEGGVIPTEPRSLLFDVWMVAARAQVVYQLRTEKQGNVLMPFFAAGAGLIQIVSVGPIENAAIVKKDSVISPFIGGGAKYRTGGGWGVRVDARAAYVKPVDSGVPIEVELLLGIYKELGYKTPAKKVEAPPLPPKDEDPDKDGIIGAADKCPNEAEDKDGFQDEDGCPDPDNDGDGILDAADKCPDQPETKNGYQDEDGCPDEVPATLKQFTGVIQGINFKVSAADLAPGSNKILDKAIAVLKEFNDVHLEIQGHTDDTPIRAGGKYADNTALSQARADTVKAYFVSKGIEEARLISKGYGDSAPLDAPAGLTGAKLNAARAKNRRVEFKLVTNAPHPE